MSNDFIDNLMGFDPQNLDAFKEKQSTNYDANIYKTNPVKLAKSDDGIYRSRIKVIYNPKNLQKSIVHRATYGLTDQNGFFLVKSKLGNGITEGRSCPIFQAWKKLWFSKDPADKEWAKEMFEKNESDWVIIQVLEDTNQPELVGKFLYWKLPNTINLKMKDKMNPSPESKKLPVPIMDYLIGNALELVVKPGPDDPAQPQRKQREITYELSEFEAESSSIIKVDGSQLITEEELEVIDSYVTAKNDAIKAKTETRRNQAMQTIQDLTPDMKNLYRKAIQYLDENMKLDLEADCGYQPWDESTEKRVKDWIDTVLAHKDPATSNVNENNPLTNPTPETQAAPAQTFTAEVPAQPEMDMMNQVMNETPNGDLPF
jgi:hypothetical protein